ncbi:hypothetical protein [Rothia nasimurium]|uniref:hypothetical protein n=1 Tax=Rothia nasimurium TaxID=85336 RepID=UPI003BA3420C
MQTRTRGKLIAHITGAGLVAVSTLGATAVALETYSHIQETEAPTATPTQPSEQPTTPTTEQTSPATPAEPTSSAPDTVTSQTYTYVQEAPAGTNGTTTSSGS